MSIALVMIVKDEERTIGRCLASVRDWVDEIVIVDTGSTDRTYDMIRRSLGARLDITSLYTFPWTGDFAAARNYGLEQVKSEWVIQLDADEVIVSGAPQLRALPDCYWYRGFNVNVTMFNPDGKGLNSCPALRVFRSNERYEWPIHEQVRLPAITTSHLQLQIDHVGDGASQESRRERNLTMLSKAVVNDPGNKYLVAAYADEIMAIDDYEEALKFYRKANLDPRGKPWEIGTLSKVALCLVYLNHDFEAEILLSQLAGAHPGFTDAPFLLGVIAARRGDNEAARQLFEECLAIGEPRPDYPTMGGTGSWRVRTHLRELQKLGGESA